MYNKISLEIRYLIKLLIEVLFLTNCIFYIKLYFLFLSSNIEFKKNEYYLIFCNGNKQKRKIKYKNKHPEISIISPIFNREKYISRFIKNIQNQKFENIELILVDDNSVDNSIKKIKRYMKEDERILLIKNKSNKGTLISRNLGVLYSTGKYLIIPDPDDIISKNILNICYKYAEKYNYEIIRFNVYAGNRKLIFGQLYKELEKKPVFQPILKLYFYYGKGELERLDSNINNKFIKRDAFIRAINLLSNFYLNMYMIFAEDVIMSFSLYLTAKSFFFLRQIGYFYKKNAKSITNNLINNFILKAFFIKLKFFFEYYKNNKFERDITNTILKNVNKNFLNNLNIIKNLLTNRELIIFYEVLNKYINCIFITNENKNLLKYIKKLIEIKIKKG